MDVRLRAAIASDDVSVAAFCREHGISRQTFYVWRRRYRGEGLDGLEPRSRAPRSSPQRIGDAVEDAIIGLRKELADLGVDHGPSTIQWHLQRRSGSAPSEATIWRVLVRRGFVTPEPRKRPKSSFVRFEADAPNVLWQADHIDWAIATGPVKIISFLDDHSRVALRVAAVLHATTEAVWDTFCAATTLWGVPLGQLTDNGLCFSGRLRGFEVGFEQHLRAIGVIAKTSRPFHPQTCGKVERFQQTMKKRLRRQPLAATLEELQAQLNAFVDYYNHHRPHRGIGRVTPTQRWAATPPAINLGIALPSPAGRADVIVQPNGTIRVNDTRAWVGTRWAGHTARVHHDAHAAAVFIDHKLIRAIVIEPGRTYYPKPRT